MFWVGIRQNFWDLLLFSGFLYLGVIFLSLVFLVIWVCFLFGGMKRAGLSFEDCDFDNWRF